MFNISSFGSTSDFAFNTFCYPSMRLLRFNFVVVVVVVEKHISLSTLYISFIVREQVYFRGMLVT